MLFLSKRTRFSTTIYPFIGIGIGFGRNKELHFFIDLYIICLKIEFLWFKKGWIKNYYENKD